MAGGDRLYVHGADLRRNRPAGALEHAAAMIQRGSNSKCNFCAGQFGVNRFTSNGRDGVLPATSSRSGLTLTRCGPACQGSLGVKRQLFSSGPIAIAPAMIWPL